MRLYLLPVMAFCFGVELLLLLAAAKTMEMPIGFSLPLASAIQAVYAGLCMLPGWQACQGLGWRVGVLAAAGGVAFGFGVRTLPAMGMYVLLSLGASLAAEETPAALAVMGGCLLLLVLRSRGGTVPVVLRFGSHEARLTALRDTGNTLRDPVTGEGVLVVGADTAKRLCGLEKHQLADPLGAIQARVLPGLRLIPYHTVADKGFMLAVRMEHVQIGSRVGSTLVAFAPNGLDGNGAYQALTGGTV